MNVQFSHEPTPLLSDVSIRDQLGLVTLYDAPCGESETSLAELWAFALRVDRVGRDDDFFELGGDSFGAAVIATQIEEQFKVTFAPANIIGNSTIALQAKQLASLQQNPSARRSTCLVGCNTSGKLPPLFLVHGLNGFTFFSKAFFEKLGPEQPVYLFQAPGLDGDQEPLDRVEEFAKRYIGEMRQVQAEGPYNIGAFCRGGLLALEMCLQLVRQRQAIKNLLLMDPSVGPKQIAHRYPATAATERGSTWTGVCRVYWKRLLARSFNLAAGRGFVLDAGSQAWKTNLQETRRQQQKRLADINRRRSSGELFREELQYDMGVMLDVSMKLDDALRSYTPSAAYPGHAHLLVSSFGAASTIRGRLFWKNYLGSFDHEVLAGNHKDFFDTNILLVADFVKRVINDPHQSTSSPRNSQE